MASVRIHQVIDKDGEVCITGLPYRRGEEVDVIITTRTQQAGFTVGDLLASGLIGMWQDRDDIGDSPEYARRLREEAQNRGMGSDSSR